MQSFALWVTPSMANSLAAADGILWFHQSIKAWLSAWRLVCCKGLLRATYQYLKAVRGASRALTSRAEVEAKSDELAAATEAREGLQAEVAGLQAGRDELQAAHDQLAHDLATVGRPSAGT